MSEAQNKIALVTGANIGIGFQIAKALLANNYIVFVGARNIEKGEKAVTELGENAIAIQLDITKTEDIRAAVKTIEETHGYLSLLVNNAAISNVGKEGQTMEEILGSQMPSIVPLDDLRAVWGTNVFSTLEITQAFLPLLKKANLGRIVTVSSAMGSLTINANPQNPYRSAYDAVYGASKTALNGIFLSLAIELEKTNVKVHLVSPGFTATALNNFQGTDTVEYGSIEPIRVALAEDLPTGSFTGPAEYAGSDHVIAW